MTSNEALETYLDFLETSTSSTSKENHCTPRIDAVLHQYRQKATKEAGFQPNEKGVGFQDASREPLVDMNRQSYESRLIQLEDQLTSLLTRSKEQQVTCKKLPTSSSKEMCSESEDSSSSPPKARTKPQVLTAKTDHPHQRRGYKVLRKRGTGGNHVTSKVTSAQDDRRRRSDLLRQSRQQQEKPPTVQVLMLELDAEREGRWKAEQAASRLVEHIKSLQSRVTEVKTQHELAVVYKSQSEEELGKQKEANQTLRQQTQHLEESVHKAQEERAELEQRAENQLEMLRKLEESYRRLETEKMRACTTLQSRVHDSEGRAAGHERELEILRKSLKQSNNQIHQLQELLAKREEDHLKEKERCRPLDPTKLQDLVGSRVEEERNKMKATLSEVKLKLSDQEQAYHALEEEFRMGLRLEASRYNELEQEHREVCEEVEATRKTAVSVVQKEQRAVAIVEELTAMVREQKAKIRELANSKQEAIGDLKERLSGLEVEVADRNKIEARMLSLQEDKAKLEAQVMAQHSVVEGLREERKLWGQELAHQGASLAQERGTMSVQLDYLTKDCSSLRQQLQKERDAVRVKEKQVEDQVHTIQTLKKTLAEKEVELQDGSAGLAEELQELKFRLEQEEVSNMDLQERVAALLDRKDELKKDLASKSEERDQWKAKFNEVDKEWEGKVRIIDTLEENLQQLQKSFKEKESRLLLEKDNAVQSARDCKQRLKTCDDAFREQLEAKEKLYYNNLTKLVAQKDKEVSLANHKVTGVEEEMRELLQEVAKERRSMEAKFAQLSTVVQDFQKDFVQV